MGKLHDFPRCYCSMPFVRVLALVAACMPTAVNHSTHESKQQSNTWHGNPQGQFCPSTHHLFPRGLITVEKRDR